MYVYMFHLFANNYSYFSHRGAGTLEAALVASSMMNGLDLTIPQQQATPNLPHYSIHLGDIYYVGLPTEVQHCCLGIKPPLGRTRCSMAYWTKW